MKYSFGFFFCFSICSLFESFQHRWRHSWRSGRYKLRNLEMALELKTIETEVKADPSMYATIVEGNVKNEELLRWYIASIENGMATIEIVYEKDGVGTSDDTAIESTILNEPSFEVAMDYTAAMLNEWKDGLISEKL
jgi:hypothetical protein